MIYLAKNVKFVPVIYRLSSSYQCTYISSRSDLGNSAHNRTPVHPSLLSSRSPHHKSRTSSTAQEHKLINIGSLEHALSIPRYSNNHHYQLTHPFISGAAEIVRAVWPPPYVLETVSSNLAASGSRMAPPRGSAASKGLVVVTNVNCGYLDMATNFLLSVRRTSDIKVFTQIYMLANISHDKRG